MKGSLVSTAQRTVDSMAGWIGIEVRIWADQGLNTGRDIGEHTGRDAGEDRRTRSGQLHDPRDVE